jgi:hypothetical protein
MRYERNFLEPTLWALVLEPLQKFLSHAVAQFLDIVIGSISSIARRGIGNNLIL